MTNLLTFEEGAQALRIHPATLRKLIRLGRAPQPIQVGGRLLFDVRDIDRWVDAQKRRLDEVLP
jgi:predicted DNA-binding transcriptional regulator AlpA